MCAPVASTARARDQDRKFRSASTTIPGPKDGSRSSASVCSPVLYARTPPRSAPRCRTRPPSPTAPAGTLRPGWPWTAAEERGVLRAVRQSVVDPSMEITRSPQQNTPGAPPAATGPARCSNSMCSGSAPSLSRARDSEDILGCRHRRPAPRPPSHPGPAGRPAGPLRGGGDTARRPAWPSPARSRCSGPGTATMPGRSTRPAGPAAAGGGPPGFPSPRSPHPPDPAGTPWSAPHRDPVRQPPVRRQPLAHHHPQHGQITTVPKCNAIGGSLPTRARSLS